MSTTNKIMFLLLSLFCGGASAKSVNAYFYYKNAHCYQDTDTHIAGTAVLAFDDSDMNAIYGRTIENYQGACWYFPKGSIDVYKYNLFGSNVSTTYRIGYCTSCYGYVGCSTDGTCDTFMNYARAKTTSSGYQLSNKQTNNETLAEELKAPALSLQQSFTTKMISETYAIEDDGYGYYLLGGSICMIVLVTLVAVLEGLRQKRVAKDQLLFDGMGHNIRTVSIV